MHSTITPGNLGAHIPHTHSAPPEDPLRWRFCHRAQHDVHRGPCPTGCIETRRIRKLMCNILLCLLLMVSDSKRTSMDNTQRDGKATLNGVGPCMNELWRSSTCADSIGYSWAQKRRPIKNDQHRKETREKYNSFITNTWKHYRSSSSSSSGRQAGRQSQLENNTLIIGNWDRYRFAFRGSILPTKPLNYDNKLTSFLWSTQNTNYNTEFSLQSKV